MHDVIRQEIGKAVSNLLTPDRIGAIVGATLASLGHAPSNAAAVENRRPVMTRTVVDLTADDERSKEMVDLTADSDYEPTTSSRRRNTPVTPKSETVNDRTDYEPTASSRRRNAPVAPKSKKRKHRTDNPTPSSRRRIQPVAPKRKTRQPSIAELFGTHDSDSGSLFITSDTSDDEFSDTSTAPAFERPGTTDNAVTVRRNRTVTGPPIPGPSEEFTQVPDTTAVLSVQNDPNFQGDGAIQKKKPPTSTLKFAPSILGWQTTLDYSRRNRNDNLQRLPCLWTAFFNEKFRRRVILYAWRNLTRIRPGLRPWWHLGVTATPFDTNANFRDGTLLGGCRYHQSQGPKGVSNHQQKPRNIHFACDHLDNDGNRCTSMSIRLQFTWILALAFNNVTPQMWRALNEGRLAVSHLCGNTYCIEPTHFILENMSCNNERKACHQDGFCKCTKAQLVNRGKHAGTPAETSRRCLMKKAADGGVSNIKPDANNNVCPYDCGYQHWIKDSLGTDGKGLLEHIQTHHLHNNRNLDV